MPTPSMNDTSWATDYGRRPDLEAIETNPPIGFIGERIYPRANQRNIAGTITALALPQYAAAVTNRTDGNAPSTNLILNTNASFSCTEICARFGKTARDVQAAGSVWASDMQGAIGASYSFNCLLEQKRLTKLVTPIPSTADNLITPTAGAKIRSAIYGALKSLRRYRGKRVLIMGADMLDVFADSFAMKSFYEGIPFERRDAFKDRRELIVYSMQTVFLLDEVLVADDTILNAAGNASAIGDYLVVAVLPHENEVTEDSFQTTNIELGRTITYQPAEGMKPYQIESFPDFDDMVNKYTAIGMNDIVEFNPMQKRIIDPSNIDFSGGAPVSITGGTVVTIDGGTISA